MCNMCISFQQVLGKSPYVRTVIAHPDTPVGRPELLAGEPSYFTTTTENGVKLELDFGAVTFDAALAAERQRLLDTFSSDDVVCELSILLAGRLCQK
jgi:tRNA G37 N-methylase Trm5